MRARAYVGRDYRSCPAWLRRSIRRNDRHSATPFLCHCAFYASLALRKSASSTSTVTLSR